MQVAKFARQNSELISKHSTLREYVSNLLKGDAVHLVGNQNIWKETLMSMRAIVDAVDSEYGNAKAWKLHWDRQLLKALGIAYRYNDILQKIHNQSKISNYNKILHVNNIYIYNLITVFNRNILIKNYLYKIFCCCALCSEMPYHPCRGNYLKFEWSLLFEMVSYNGDLRLKIFVQSYTPVYDDHFLFQ